MPSTLRDKVVFWISQLVLAAAFAFLFEHVVISGFINIKVTKRNVREGDTLFRLTKPDTYLLKIRGDGLPDRVFFNGEPLVHTFYNNRPRFKELTFLIPAPWIAAEDNYVTVEGEGEYTLRISNNLGLNDFGVILVKDGAPARPGPNVIVTFVAIVLLGAYAFLCRTLFDQLFGLPLECYTVFYLLSFGPCLLLFFLCYALTLSTPLAFYLFPRPFFGIGSFFTIFMQIVFSAVLLIRMQRLSDQAKETLHLARAVGKNVIEHTKEKYEAVRVMGNDVVGRTKETAYAGRAKGIVFLNRAKKKNAIARENVFRAIRWWTARDAGDKAIYIFMALIGLCIPLVTGGLSPIANFLTNIAILSLIFGIVQKLIRHAQP